MLYPDNIEQKLGFDIIRQWLKDYCQSNSGKQQVERIKFSSNHTLIMRLLDQSMEMKAVLTLEDFPYPRSIDSIDYLDNCKIEGTYLEVDELKEVAAALISATKIRRFFESKQDDYPTLATLKKFLYFNDKIADEINQIFNDKGEIRDDASAELKKIRKNIKNADHNLHRSLASIFEDSKKKGFIPDGLTPTIRDGRLVVPVLAEHKRKVRGLIHDESSTGHTVYIEPSESLEANNALIELRYAERREIIRILTDLSDQINQVLLKALAKQPQDRYATVDAFCQELVQAALPRLSSSDGADPVSLYDQEAYTRPVQEPTSEEWPRWVWMTLAFANIGMMLLIAFLLFTIT